MIADIDTVCNETTLKSRRSKRLGWQDEKVRCPEVRLSAEIFSGCCGGNAWDRLDSVSWDLG